MTLAADRTTDGFELIGNLMMSEAPNPVEYELTPNTAFSRGDMVVLTNGKVAKAAANATNVLGVMAETFTTATNPSADLTKGKVYDHPFNIYRCSFADHRDAVADGAGSTTTLVDSTLAGTDDYWIGALLYIYAGAGKGCTRTITDYVAATGTLTWIDPLPEATGTTSYYILLGAGTAAGNVINVGSVGVDLKDENTIDANATIATEAGPLAVRNIYPDKLMMDVVIRKHRWNSV